MQNEEICWFCKNFRLYLRNFRENRKNYVIFAKRLGKMKMFGRISQKFSQNEIYVKFGIFVSTVFRKHCVPLNFLVKIVPFSPFIVPELMNLCVP
jgi:hypothetical protein